MSKLVSGTQSDRLAKNEHQDQLDNGVTGKVKSNKPKLTFTALLLIVFLCICTVVASLTLFIYQQQQQIKLVEQQHKPVETELLQLSYLLSADRLLKILYTSKTTIDYVSAQKKLSDINKKLISIDSQYQTIFQQWLLKNKSKQTLASRISKHHTRNQQMKSAFLKQLSMILSHLENQQQIGIEKAKLVQLQQELNQVFSAVESLNLHTPLRIFEESRENIDGVLSSELFLTIHAKQNDNVKLSAFEQQLLVLEDLAIEKGLLAKWQGHLRLVGDYRQQLFDMQQQTSELLEQLANGKVSQANSVNPDKSPVFESIAKLSLTQLQLRLIVAVVFIFTLFAYLLWFIRERFQAYALKNDERFELLQNRLLGSSFDENTSKKLALLTQQCQTQQEQLVTAQKTEAQQSSALELFKSTTNAAAEIGLITQQQCSKELSSLIQTQLMSLALLSLEKSSIDESLNEIYSQTSLLSVRLKQIQLHSYLRGDKATLSLRDVNLVAEMQAILLNQSEVTNLQNNQMSLDISKNIQADVKLDAEMFAELIRVFSQLLLAEQNGATLAITLALQDKNEGQQNISFTGVVKAEHKAKNASKPRLTKLTLPTLLQYIHEGNKTAAESELLSYFYILLARQHGDQLSVSLTEQGYQLSFILPLAVMLKREQLSDSSLFVAANSTSSQPELIELVQRYQVQPIEILLAVKKPKEQQALFQLLRAFGLQVTLVTHVASQQQQWQSGRYALLITEFAQSPFVDFIPEFIDDNRLQRGIFGLGHSFTSPEASEFSTGKVSALTKNGYSTAAINQLKTLLSPWLRLKPSSIIEPCHNAVIEAVDSNEPFVDKQKVALIPDNNVVFDFDSYLLNQGSAELALYMLDDYVVENSTLVAELTQALASGDLTLAHATVSSLLLNGKILAATDLIEFCQHWQTLLSERLRPEKTPSTRLPSEEQSAALQAKLLNKTKREVAAIARYAQAL